MAIVTQPASTAEPDLLTGFQRSPIHIVELGDQCILIGHFAAPNAGWSHSDLDWLNSFLMEAYKEGWNAYFYDGSQRHWIGSSEV